MFDMLIQNGHVIDGSGTPAFTADIGITNGRISYLGSMTLPQAQIIIDAEKRIVCPGFIDMHGHSDLYLIVNAKAESKIRQGITTEVIGNCGFSMAPIAPSKIDLFKEREGVLAQEVDWDWSTFHEYLSKLEQQGVSVNVVPLVGHGTIRMNVLEFDNRAPSKAELKEMQAYVEEAMDAGAQGLSTGLIYVPGAYAETAEIIALAEIASLYGSIYTTHVRGEGAELLKSYDEALRIGREANIPVEISHMKAAGRPHWGRIQEALHRLETAQREGLDVTGDVYPYTAGSTSLSACLPPWVHAGGLEPMISRLHMDTVRQRIRSDIEHGISGWENLAGTAGWENIVVSYCEHNKQYEGLRVTAIAEKQGVSPVEAILDLLIEERGIVSIILHMISEEDMRYVLQHPLSMIGTDGYCYAPYGVLARGNPHPRNYGTFPRILGRYVREFNVLTLPAAIQKMTSLPAHKLGLPDRGLLKEGCWADIVIFDPVTIIDRATYQAPHQYPEGVEYVIVNGQIVVKGPHHTDQLPGHILRKHSRRTGG